MKKIASIIASLFLTANVAAQTCNDTGTCVRLDNGTYGKAPLTAIAPQPAATVLCVPAGVSATPSACANLPTGFALTIDLSTQVTGNLGVSHLDGGASASSTSFWAGDGHWRTPPGGLVPGGGPGAIQTNNGIGGLSAFTASGDCTINTTTGAVICTKTNGVNFAPIATSGSASDLTTGTVPTAALTANNITTGILNSNLLDHGKFFVSSGSIPTAASANFSVPSDAQEIEIEVVGLSWSGTTPVLSSQFKVGGTTVSTGYDNNGVTIINTTLGSSVDVGAALWQINQTSGSSVTSGSLSMKFTGLQNGSRKGIFMEMFTLAANPFYAKIAGDNTANTGLVSDVTLALSSGNFTGGTFRLYKIK